MLTFLSFNPSLDLHMRRSHTPNADQCSGPCQTRLKGTIIRGASGTSRPGNAVSLSIEFYFYQEAICHVQGHLDAQVGVTDGGRCIQRLVSTDQRRRTNARLFPHCSKPLPPVSRSYRHTLDEPAAFLDSFACGQLSGLQASPIRRAGPVVAYLSSRDQHCAPLYAQSELEGAKQMPTMSLYSDYESRGVVVALCRFYTRRSLSYRPAPTSIRFPMARVYAGTAPRAARPMNVRIHWRNV